MWFVELGGWGLDNWLHPPAVIAIVTGLAVTVAFDAVPVAGAESRTVVVLWEKNSLVHATNENKH